MTTVTEEVDEEGSAEPSLAGLLRNAAGAAGLTDLAGWEGLDDRKIGAALALSRQRQQKTMREEALLFRRVFIDSADGRKVLDILLDQTLRRSAWPVFSMQSPEMLMAVGIWRESENSFVQGIIQAIAQAENKDVQRRDAP